MSTEILAPLDGVAMPMSEVPDPVFSAEMVGAGVAIEPLDTDAATTVVAPVAGSIVKLHPHAAVIVTDEGTGVLLHVGIDTVGKADLFEVKAAEGDRVAAGDPLITFSPNAVHAARPERRGAGRGHGQRPGLGTEHRHRPGHHRLGPVLHVSRG